jgi:peptide deformylase
MILPIIAYGDPVLRKKAVPLEPGHPGLEQLITNMFETMYSASGIGLAAPQVGHAIRLFVVDTIAVLKNLNEEDEDNSFKGEVGFKKVFINAKTVEKNGESWPYNEGCLSIPKIREDIDRPDEITLEYLDEDFKSPPENL